MGLIMEKRVKFSEEKIKSENAWWDGGWGGGLKKLSALRLLPLLLLSSKAGPYPDSLDEIVDLVAGEDAANHPAHRRGPNLHAQRAVLNIANNHTSP